MKTLLKVIGGVVLFIVVALGGSSPVGVNCFAATSPCEPVTFTVTGPLGARANRSCTGNAASFDSRT